MGYVDGDFDLETDLVERRAIPPGENEKKFNTAERMNSTNTAIGNLRSWIQAAAWYGLAAQAADPEPDDITNYIWLKDDGTLWKTVDGTATEIGAGGGGGITNGAGANVLMKSDGTNAVASSISDNGSLVTHTKPINQTIDVGASQAYALQVMMRGGGVPHTTEAVAIVGFVTNMTFGATSNAIGGQFRADATNAGGVVTNIAVQGTALNGDNNYSWLSTAGEMRQEGDTKLATAAGSWMQVGDGTAAVDDELRINKNTTFDSAKTVSLGSTVANFAVPGSSSDNPNIRIGRPNSTSFQLALQNVKSAAAETGIAVHVDTTATSNARGGMRIYRSAGGSTQVGGFEVAGGTNSLVTGAAANDILMYSRASGARVILGTGDNTTPTARLIIDKDGKVTIAGGSQGIEMGTSGPKWVSGSGSPEGAIAAPIGSLYSRTDGGASTSLYVKESGTGNTGWVAK